MSVVLNFCHARKTAHPGEVRDKAPGPGACEVIIFPGVRIERRGQAAPSLGHIPDGRARRHATADKRLCGGTDD